VKGMEAHLSEESGPVSWATLLPVVLALAGAKILLHLLCNGRYGYFIDEFYYLACSRRPDWGYVDQPPFSIGVLGLITAVAGEGLRTIRLLPALLGGATVVLTAALVREFGGGRFALLLAGLGVMINPLFLFMNNYYSMNAFDIFFWTAAFFVFARILHGGTDRLWLLLGLILGLAVMNKVGALWPAAGFFCGLALTGQRGRLRRPWPWVGAGLALILFLPYVLWEVKHAWPTLEFMRNATAVKYARLTRPGFLVAQVLELHPLAFPIWLCGALSLLFFRLSRTFRPLGIAWGVVLLILLVNSHSKAEYIAPAAPALLAAGGVVIERWIERGRAAGSWWPRWVRWSMVGLLAAGGALTAPYTLPVLPIERFITYARALGFMPGTVENKELGLLPQHYADMFGWDNLAATVARVCDRLPAEERAQACIFAPSYGPSGALELLGRKYHLPPVISGHNSYWIWGPGSCTGQVVIRLYGSREDMLRAFRSVEPADTVRSRYVMPYENNIPIWICRDTRMPVREAWASVKHYE
jgi:hypothetical protein